MTIMNDEAVLEEIAVLGQLSPRSQGEREQLLRLKGVRLKVEQNQLVAVFE